MQSVKPFLFHFLKFSVSRITIDGGKWGNENVEKLN